MDDFYPFDRDVDVIFCRNILIYFEREKQDAVINRLSGHLRPGGYLLLGHSESLAGTGQTFLQQVAPTIFRKIR
jgi:chemotaxis protein methyltransferase CheR